MTPIFFTEIALIDTLFWRRFTYNWLAVCRVREAGIHQSMYLSVQIGRSSERESWSIARFIDELHDTEDRNESIVRVLKGGTVFFQTKQEKIGVAEVADDFRGGLGIDMMACGVSNPEGVRPEISLCTTLSISNIELSRIFHAGGSSTIAKLVGEVSVSTSISNYIPNLPLSPFGSSLSVLRQVRDELGPRFHFGCVDFVRDSVEGLEEQISSSLGSGSFSSYIYPCYKISDAKSSSMNRSFLATSASHSSLTFNVEEGSMDFVCREIRDSIGRGRKPTIQSSFRLSEFDDNRLDDIIRKAGAGEVMANSDLFRLEGV